MPKQAKLRLFRQARMLVILLLNMSLSPLAFGATHTIIKKKIICITQILAHESLDKVRLGVLDALKTQGYNSETATILFENAYGNIATAAQIAQKFVGRQADVIIAIATPSAQTAIRASRDSHTPIVFASVTDPLKAKLVANLKHPGQNVTGTRNPPLIDQQIKLIQNTFPQLRSLGIVLNYGEDNSVALLQALRAYCEPRGIHVEAAMANTSADVQSATQKLVGKIDVLFLLQDNTVAAALPAVLNTTLKNKIPVFSSYIEAVNKGALFGLAYDEYTIGQQTGSLAVAILRGKNPGDLAVEDPHKINFSINKETAQRLGIHFSSKFTLKQQRKTV